jgi:Cu/Ag efflux pump CusA
MSKDKGKKTEEETLDFPTDGEEQQEERTVEERIDIIESGAASIVAVNNMGQAINNIANLVEKIDLRLKNLEQRAEFESSDFKDALAKRVVEEMVAYDSKKEK